MLVQKLDISKISAMRKWIKKLLSLFSEETETVNFKKKAIRKEIRELKKFFPTAEKQIAGNSVFEKIETFTEFKNAYTILIYWAIPDELPTQETIKRWCVDKQILLPSIDGNRLVLKRYSPDGQLTQKTLGIWEPDLSENYEGNVDLVIVPGIAFDHDRNRLGRGKGYYDRFFKKYKPIKVGVGFDFQLKDSIPIARHDIKMDKIVTPSTTIE